MKEEREELRRNLEEMKERIEKVERGGVEDKLMQSRLGGSRIMEKMGELERRLKIREKEETRRNVVIREVEGERRKAVEEILEVVRVKVEIEEIRKIGEDKGKKGRYY